MCADDLPDYPFWDAWNEKRTPEYIVRRMLRGFEV
jgi:hypothetical protein